MVGNGVDLDYFAPLPSAESKILVFVGVLNYKPNIDGIAWFVQHVFEQLRKRIHDVKLLVVGRHPTPQVEELDNEPGVEIIGSVPERAHLSCKKHLPSSHTAGKLLAASRTRFLRPWRVAER